MACISFLYKHLIILRCQAYQKGIFFSRKLPISIISVGNLTVGGTGKTPTSIYLARLLQREGRRTAVLSRGYKGDASLNVNVVSDGKRVCLSPDEAGDESFLLVEKLPGVPVLTGRDRGLLCEYAMKNFSTEVAILDDGFQHLKLQRDLDIVLLDGNYPLGNGYLLPRGTLREPPQHLKRAHIILVAKPDKTTSKEKIERTIRNYNPFAPVFFVYYSPVLLERLNSKETISWEYLRGQKVVALAGLAHPEPFARLLTHLGAEVVDTIFFPDHCCYRTEYLAKIKVKAIIVTTEKDAVKLRSISLPTSEILVLGIEIRVEEEVKFQAAIK
ncbi:MAG: tetraacyldisaccharide 4'-kinase, partial [Proteobacteria bacterium]|nr:tetraacyldisaccharide 4'-kinase [Pseudomonadota bacterium]